jgi:hypothetical protein
LIKKIDYTTELKEGELLIRQMAELLAFLIGRGGRGSFRGGIFGKSRITKF